MDPEARKSSLRSITYGLFVATAADASSYACSAVNWLSQASFEPPLVMAGFNVEGGLHTLVERTGSFAVNTLGADQLEVGEAFFGATEAEGDEINGYRFEPGPVTGAPLLLATPYWFECRVTDKVMRGDHTVYVAEVVGAGVRDGTAMPLDLRSTGMSYGG